MKRLLFFTTLCSSLYLFSCHHSNTSQQGVTASTDNSDHQKLATGQSPITAHAVDNNKMLAYLTENSVKLKQEKLTIDPDHNFTLLMATHHEGAIQLTEELLAQVVDNELRGIAQNIAAVKRTERAQLQAFAKAHIPVKGDTSSTKRFMKPIERMGAGHTTDTTGKVEVELAQLLLYHHQTGLELIDVELSLSRNPEVKELAQNIRIEQEKGIRLLENWLQEQSHR